MFMVVDSGADPTKGEIDRGTMTDLQVWTLEAIMNLDPKVSPYAALSVVVGLTGFISRGFPVNEAVVRSCVLEAIGITESVAEEIEAEAEKGQSNE